jgi:hypothetical protein
MARFRASLAAAALLTFAVAGGDAGAHSEQGLLALTAEAAADARVVSLVATLKYATTVTSCRTRWSRPPRATRPGSRRHP